MAVETCQACWEGYKPNQPGFFDPLFVRDRRGFGDRCAFVSNKAVRRMGAVLHRRVWGAPPKRQSGRGMAVWMVAGLAWHGTVRVLPRAGRTPPPRVR